jgi:N-glycosylase/DNA lyase
VIHIYESAAHPGPIVPNFSSWGDVPQLVLPLNGEPVSLDQTLACGQAFRWHQREEESWEGIAGGRVWRLARAGDVLLARAAPKLPEAEAAAFLRRYFALDLPVRAIQRDVAAHPAAADAVAQFEGLRILRQDPRETVLTFAIATATNVPRVTRSVGEVARRFGAPIAVVDGVQYHDFPDLEGILAAPTDELFGPCNLAYRARSIQAIARAIAERPTGWLQCLRRLPYLEAHAALDELPFYGPKVSDCACLFGLGFDEAVPVDVHVWAIAHQLFGDEIPTRTLTPRTYRKIGDLFRASFGRWAGWAQQYLFCARRAVPVRERSRPGSS